MTRPTVSVIVPLFNNRDIVSWCLDSIPEDVELIVVDDASTDATADHVAAHHPRALLIRNEHNAGFGTSANRGLSRATGDVRIVLNSDARFCEGAVGPLVDALVDASVGIAGPRLTFPEGSLQLSAASFPTVGNFMAGSFALNEVYRALRPDGRFRWQSALSRRDHDTTQDVDWVKGACLAISAACFEATGGFDPAYRMYVEECDLCWRATQLGWKVRYVAESHVEHLGGASGSGDPARQARFNLAGEARFMERAYGPAVLPKWRVARLVSSAVKALVLAPAAMVDRRARARLRWHVTVLRVLGARRRSRVGTSEDEPPRTS